MTNDQQTLLLVGAGAFTVYYFFKKWKMGGNKVKIKEMLQNGAKVIDVRSRGEFSTGHFSGAINIPLDELPGKVSTIGKKDEPVIVYCASGMRSSSAQRVLQSAGFTNVENGINHMNLQSLR
ncbi:MAG TPA: rhodanese-like domain-containing protein, partial [Turneriella sp.]|nr:rhodanese-like domain-containing protein [Turneriella sp.]HMY11245.1 rhodanese-like domain-containing protein [Turneriella sp.]HNA80558.1 rhodanese-like domain-containing protein [Turneriella sp.]HNL09724.1 rhodanese-like domain-containing protein [Turneriella sp.]HNL55071.1 rhodanese-like domain-containing protein [Turneriella sp.]